MIRIMIVEDEEVIRKGILDLISRGAPDFRVVKEAHHGREALEYLNHNVVDAIITDIRMREMDGLQMVEKLRSQYETLPVIIVSGYGDFGYAQKALQQGVTDYLLKPVDRKAFMTSLNKIRLALHPGEEQTDAPSAGNTTETGTPNDSEGRRLIHKLKAYIQAHPGEDLRLQTLSERVHLNSSYLSQLFKQTEGINLSDYIAEMRIREACRLLRTTGLKIYDVARLSGYQSPKHFMLVFKQHTGLTPSSYRDHEFS
ncbi:DNA-binding response regulator [Paenibacillus albidus]|uniref:DNA-binding response regulator n=1 Tax=Paenibacillus albidus TaxID=2041023 RepID=A0A917C615_9BACL|nr:response regulator [Paenibacillus albidus]GGF73630.1 DNA-binding response regulator [Paenibacillus albidus]